MRAEGREGFQREGKALERRHAEVGPEQQGRQEAKRRKKDRTRGHCEGDRGKQNRKRVFGRNTKHI